MLCRCLGQYKEHGIETEVKILAGYSPGYECYGSGGTVRKSSDNAMESCGWCKRERYISVKNVERGKLLDSAHREFKAAQ